MRSTVKPETAAKALSVVGFFGMVANAARLPYFNQADGVNYIFNTSSALYDYLLSRRMMRSFNSGTCGLEPGIIHNDYSHCTELVNLGNSFTVPGLNPSVIQVFSCKQSNSSYLAVSEKCVAKLAVNEYSDAESDFMFYLTFGMLALTALASFILLVNKYVDVSKLCSRGEEVNRPAKRR